MLLVCGKYFFKFHDLVVAFWLEVLVGQSLFFCLESRPFILVLDNVEGNHCTCEDVPALLI